MALILVGKEHVDDSLVAPGYHVRLDKGMSYKFATPLEVKKPFKVIGQNGYVIHIGNAAGETVAMVPLPKGSWETDYVEANKNRPTLAQALWIAETIVEKFNEL